LFDRLAPEAPAEWPAPTRDRGSDPSGTLFQDPEAPLAGWNSMQILEKKGELSLENVGLKEIIRYGTSK
jgi:hypothetical protein